MIKCPKCAKEFEEEEADWFASDFIKEFKKCGKSKKKVEKYLRDLKKENTYLYHNLYANFHSSKKIWINFKEKNEELADIVWDKIIQIRDEERIEKAKQCKNIEDSYTLELKTKTIVELSNRQKNAKLNNIKGDFTEYLAKKHYTKEGYSIAKIIHHLSHAEDKENTSGGSEFNEIGIQKVCLRNNDNMKLFGKVSDLIKITPKQGISYTGMPDFFCANEKDAFFVECKQDLKNFKKGQEQKYADILNAGFRVEVFCTPSTIDATHSTTEIFELKEKKK